MSDDEPNKHLKRPVNLDELIAQLRRYAKGPRRPDASLSRVERLAYRLFRPGFTDTTSDPNNTKH